MQNWALLLAKQEQLADLVQIEATALLHDVGLAYVTERRYHAEIGADIVSDFLTQKGFFSKPQIIQICTAIRLHSSSGPRDWLADLLCNAECMELFGAVGIMRAFTS